MQRRLRFLAATAVLALVFAFGAAACGSGDDDSTSGGGGAANPITEQTPFQDSGGTPEGGNSGGETPLAEDNEGSEGSTPGAGGGAGGSGGGEQVQIGADNSESFSTDQLTAAAGSVTISFDNREDGVTHNFALYDSPDSAQNLIEATELQPGPSTSELALDLEAGEYYYNCQVHPQMTGVLTAE